MSDSSYKCYVKNLKDGKRTIKDVSTIWEITEVSSAFWKRKNVSITPSIEQFMTRIKSEVPVFGVVEGSAMVKHFIIEVGHNEKELEGKLEESRPSDPKRLSTSDASLPIKLFLNYEEHVKAKNAKSQNAIQKDKVSKTSESGNILLRHQQKHSKGNHRSKEQNKLKDLPSMVLQGQSNTPKECDVLKSTQMEMQIQEMGKTIECLKGKIKNLTEQRDTALTEAQALRLHIDQLQKDLAEAKKSLLESAPKALIEELTQSVKEIPGRLQSCKVEDKDECPLNKLVYACDLEENFKDFLVPPGMVYVGQGQVIKHKRLIEIEEDETLLSKRGELVFKEICSDGMEHYSLQGHANAKGSTKIIPKHVKKAVSRILRKMTWKKGFQVTTDELNKFFVKHPGAMRRRGKGEGKTQKKESKKTAGKAGHGTEDNVKGRGKKLEKGKAVGKKPSNTSDSDISSDEGEPKKKRKRRHRSYSTSPESASEEEEVEQEALADKKKSNGSVGGNGFLPPKIDPIEEPTENEKELTGSNILAGALQEEEAKPDSGAEPQSSNEDKLAKFLLDCSGTEEDMFAGCT